ncbi:MAG TPA: CHRD domain-containing protein [Pseudolabrys sp.]
MKKLAAGGLLMATPILVGSAIFAAAQMNHMAMTTMFVAQLDAKQVVGGSASTATGTGAFLIDAKKRTMAYKLTYEGLASDGAKSIALYNFGSGKDGKMVQVLCGETAQPCPKAASATLSGHFEGSDARVLDYGTLGEFASERIYVEIVAADGKPEIRGQLSPNQAMVMVSNYTVDLKPAAGTDSKGTGTAVVSEAHLPDGKISVFYAATVAGTLGAPTNAAMVSGPAPGDRTFKVNAALPRLRVLTSADKKTGGSLTGVYEIDTKKPTAPVATRLFAEAKGEPGLVVATSRYPNGELYGALVPVK